MGSWNGLVASLTNPGLSGVSFASVNTFMPGKMFAHGQFGVAVSDGVSGTFAVEVVGAVAGATFVIAGRTNISAVGSYPVPAVTYVGTSGTVTGSIGVPRPFGVNFLNVVGSTAVAGFTASVYFAGEY